MVQQKELLTLTVYIRGGYSPIAMGKQFPTYIHETCILFDTIFGSACQCGLQFKINPDDLITATGAEICDLVE